MDIQENFFLGRVVREVVESLSLEVLGNVDVALGDVTHFPWQCWGERLGSEAPPASVTP